MEDLSLHILDIAENSIDAGATKVEIEIMENIRDNLLTIKIKDNGSGMDDKTLKKVVDPFYTTRKTRRVGLGIPMLAHSAREADGDMDIKSKKGEGTTITANFVYDHIDRRPFGNMTETIINLLARSGQEFDIFYKHCINEDCFIFNSMEIKNELSEVPINNPEVLNFLKKKINEELKELKNQEGKSEKT